jgi:hypothetical protein
VTTHPPAGHPEFSLTRGGPILRTLYRLLPGKHEYLKLGGRVAAAILVSWVPLLVLALLSRNDAGAKLTFLRDIETQVRFLVALPLFIAAEAVVQQRLGTTVRGFLDNDMIPEADIGRFEDGVRRATFLESSWIAEVLMLALAFIVGHQIWQQGVALDEVTWYSRPGPDGDQLTRAGFWFTWVSIPFFQFLYIRWYYRLFLWYQLLFRVSRLHLRLVPPHPDRAGGLGFVGLAATAVMPLLLGQGVLLAGLIASRIFGSGRSLQEFQAEILGLVLFIVVAFIGPMLMFSPALLKAKREGLLIYGKLALEHGRRFENRWLAGPGVPDEHFLGTGDIQSQADMNTVYNAVSDMRPAPFGLQLVIQLVIVAVAPLLPLTLTLVPFSTIVEWILARLL